MFNDKEYEELRHELANALRRDTAFRTERTLLLRSSDQRTNRLAVQLLSIRAGDMNPADLEDIWVADLVQLAREAAEPPAKPTVVNEW